MKVMNFLFSIILLVFIQWNGVIAGTIKVNNPNPYRDVSPVSEVILVSNPERLEFDVSEFDVHFCGKDHCPKLKKCVIKPLSEVINCTFRSTKYNKDVYLKIKITERINHCANCFRPGRRCFITNFDISDDNGNVYDGGSTYPKIRNVLFDGHRDNKKTPIKKGKKFYGKVGLAHYLEVYCEEHPQGDYDSATAFRYEYGQLIEL